MWYESANRDERHFDDPYTFDMPRTPNEHVGFGAGGPHFCLGANLARREIRVMFEELFRWLPDIEATGEPDYLRSPFIHGIKRMPCTFTPTDVPLDVDAFPGPLHVPPMPELPDDFDPHPARDASLASMRAVEAGDREAGWRCSPPDAVVEDPIGPSPFDPDGRGHHGRDGIAAFYDNVIGPNDSVTFEITRVVGGRQRGRQRRHHHHDAARRWRHGADRRRVHLPGRRRRQGRRAPRLLGARPPPFRQSLMASVVGLRLGFAFVGRRLS